MSKQVDSDLRAAIAASQERRAQKVSREDLIMAALEAYLPHLVEVIEDMSDPMLGFSVSLRPDGGYLAIAKRESNVEEQVMMAFGDSFASALRKLNHKLNVGEWRKNKTWAERQEELKQSKSKK